MSLVDRLSGAFAHYIVLGSKNKFVNPKPIEGISKEISELKVLKDKLVEKDKEIQRRTVEWDRTFDAIIDNIVIIDGNRNIYKVNKSFVQCVKNAGGSWTELVGMSWSYFHKNIMRSEDHECIVTKCFDTKETQDTIFTSAMDNVYSICTNPIFDHNGNVVSVVRVSRDITKYEKQKLKLDRRSKLFAAISEMSRTLTNHDKWDIALSDILRELGLAVGAHRVYIFENQQRENKLCAELKSVWLNQISIDCISGKDIHECINYDSVPDVKSDMERGLSVTTNLPKCDLCPHKKNCICSDEIIVSAVPIFSNKEWWGFIGFDYYNGAKQFKEDDETILRIAADIIGGVIYRRKKYYDSLDNKN